MARISRTPVAVVYRTLFEGETHMWECMDPEAARMLAHGIRGRVRWVFIHDAHPDRCAYDAPTHEHDDYRGSWGSPEWT